LARGLNCRLASPAPTGSPLLARMYFPDAAFWDGSILWITEVCKGNEGTGISHTPSLQLQYHSTLQFSTRTPHLRRFPAVLGPRPPRGFAGCTMYRPESCPACQLLCYDIHCRRLFVFWPCPGTATICMARWTGVQYHAASHSSNVRRSEGFMSCGVSTVHRCYNAMGHPGEIRHALSVITPL